MQRSQRLSNDGSGEPRQRPPSGEPAAGRLTTGPADDGRLSPGAILALQRSAGNARVQRMLDSDPTTGPLLQRQGGGEVAAPPRPPRPGATGGTQAPPRPPRPPRPDASTTQAPAQATGGGRARSGAVSGQEAAKQAQEAVGDVKGRFSLREISHIGFAELIANITGLESAWGTASATLDVEFGSTVGTGVANVAEIGVYLPIKLSGGFSVADDRRFRVQGSIGFGLQVEAKIKHLFKVHAGGELTLSVSGAYQDHYHFAAHVFAKIAELLRKLKVVLAKHLGAKDKAADPKLVGEVHKLGPPPRGWEELAKIPMEFWSSKKAGSVSAGFDFAETTGAEGSYSYETVTSHRKDEKGNDLVKKGWTKSLALDVYCKWAGAIDIGIGVSMTRISGDPNPDNDGDYISLKLTPGNTIPITTPLVQGLAEKIPTSLENFSKDSFESAMQQNIDDAQGSAFGEMFDDPLGGVEQNAGIEFGFIREVPGEKDDEKPTFLSPRFFKPSSWYLMYARIFKDMSIGYEGEASAPVMPGLNVGAKAGFAFSRQTGVYDVLGTKSLAYFRSFYNGLLNRGERGRAQWQAWKAVNQPYLHGFMENVGKPGTPAHAEAKSLAADLASVGTRGPADRTQPRSTDSPGLVDLKRKARDFQPKCSDWFSPPKLERAEREKRRADYMKQGYDLLDALFDAYLEVYRLKGIEEEAKNWHHKGNLVAGVNLLGAWAQVDIAGLETVKGDEDSSWMTSLRVAAEHGYKGKLSINGRQHLMWFDFQGDTDGDLVGIKKEFVKKVRSKFPHHADFPRDIAMLDGGLWAHYKEVEKLFSIPKDKGGGIASQARAQQDRAWRSGLDDHLEKVFDVVFDAPVKSRPPARKK